MSTDSEALPIEKEVLTPRTIGGLIPVTAGDFKPNRKLDILIYGEPGVGKTTLAASADEVPDFRKVLHIDIEGGTLSIESIYPKVELVHLSGFEQKEQWGKLQEIYNDLRDGTDHGYGTVILDNITEGQNIGLIKVMDDAIAKANDPDSIDIDVPRQRDWGVIRTRMAFMVRAYRDLPLHTIMVAHEKEGQDPKTGLLRKRPSLSGKSASDVPGAFNMVFRMYVKEVDGVETRIVATQASDDFMAKDRSNTLPAYIPNPTMKKIHELMTGASNA